MVAQLGSFTFRFQLRTYTCTDSAPDECTPSIPYYTMIQFTPPRSPSPLVRGSSPGLGQQTQRSVPTAYALSGRSHDVGKAVYHAQLTSPATGRQLAHQPPVFFSSSFLLFPSSPPPLILPSQLTGKEKKRRRITRTNSSSSCHR